MWCYVLMHYFGECRGKIITGGVQLTEKVCFRVFLPETTFFVDGFSHFDISLTDYVCVLTAQRACERTSSIVCALFFRSAA